MLGLSGTYLETVVPEHVFVCFFKDNSNKLPFGHGQLVRLLYTLNGVLFGSTP